MNNRLTILAVLVAIVASVATPSARALHSPEDSQPTPPAVLFVDGARPYWLGPMPSTLPAGSSPAATTATPRMFDGHDAVIGGALAAAALAVLAGGALVRKHGGGDLRRHVHA